MAKKHLITSALPYINGVKHLGNLIGSLLPADVYARYLRQKGETVAYICGTDDHGVPAEIAAKEAGKPVNVYCDEMYQLQKKIYEDFGIQFDYFGKTSDQSNFEITQAIFKQLDAHGYIQENVIHQFYCKIDERFLPDRFIIGTCPKCDYDKARGDQCDGCGSLLDPTDLINPRSALNPENALELRDTQHLFLDLPKLKDKVEAWSKTLENPSNLVTGVFKKWLSDDLHSRCITRDLSWGVPVPKPGYENKVFYVWFDAPNGYMSITKDWLAKQGESDWESWWKNPNEVEYSQFMAKDNLPFHAIFWPAILLGTEENWTFVHNLKVFNWLTYEGGKFSTSQKRGVFTDTALKLFPADYWRYYLLANTPEGSDADFDFGDFIHTINTDLADTLGNFCARVLTLTEKYFDSRMPAPVADPALEAAVTRLCQDVDHAYHNLRFRDMMKHIRALWQLGNEYITEKQPWKVAKEDRIAAGGILANCLHLVRIYAITTAPIMPTTSQQLWDLVKGGGRADAVSIDQSANLQAIPEGHPISQKVVLFQKIEKEQEEVLKAEYS